jgi:enamine deaminase RidA (YjgF/YER057c/UK114 family)
MQGIDPATNRLVQDPQARIRQAFLNIRLIAQSEGASLQDCVRLTVYVSDLHRFAPMVDKVQAELWSKPPYPPRTMIEVQRLFDDEIAALECSSRWTWAGREVFRVIPDQCGQDMNDIVRRTVA